MDALTRRSGQAQTGGVHQTARGITGTARMVFAILP
jgi:hypothetical protein